MDETTLLPGHVLVVVRREGRWWLAEGPSAQVVRTRSLHTAVHRARELVGEGMPVHYQFHTGDPELDRLVIQIQAARAAARQHEARVRRLTRSVLMLPSGGSVRDIGVLVGLSYQRIHQLMRQGGERQSDNHQCRDSEPSGDEQTGDGLLGGDTP